METVTFIVICIVLLLLAGLWLRLGRERASQAEWERLRLREADYAEAVRQRDEQMQQVARLQEEKTRLATALEHERRAAQEKISLLEQAEERLKVSFENLANRIVEDKGRVLTEQNRERLGQLLQPFKEQLESFRNRVDEVHRAETEQAAQLVEQVRQLQALSGQVSQEANQLAKAIKGDSKTQGDWGEVIVERIFEASGLVRDIQYRTQVAHRDADGKLKRPDFLVQLPDAKALIVDAKVSLTAYEKYASAEDESERQAALQAHVRSVRRHIEELQAKDYTQLLGNQTLDFVIMCIPLEPAYQAAMQADDNLLYDLGGSNVVITGPTTLMITLKLIAQIWRRENENRNAEQIADKAGKLYDHVARIVEAMQDARKRLGATQEAFDLALRRLESGRGNLVGRVEELRTLGAKTQKTIPPAVHPAALEASADPEEADQENDV